MERIAMVMALVVLGDQAVKAGHRVHIDVSWNGITVWRHYDGPDAPCDHMAIYDCQTNKAELFNEAVAFLNGLIANPVEDMEEAA
jgi:hypothetical protein